ncbi:MAG: hypothetical protein ACLF0G_14400 [Candidatus Brocadiia bacterium]
MRRRKPRYTLIVLAGLVLVGVLVAAKLATRKFAWWKEASFRGIVVARQAEWRESGEAAEAAEALQHPDRCDFYLEIEADHETRRHRVVPSLFREAREGSFVAKRAGTWEAQCAAPARGGSPPPPGEGHGEAGGTSQP